ncbi:hypothetical protein OpiT1DRAFT_01204 [Opitutaceae bacterium TAV1]|nr:hypothetical protein OpiT1DRAFT_01204 [Opitutaceae bacterium TAV1]
MNKYMKSKLLLVSALTLFGGTSVASAQTTIAQWDFSNVATGTTTNIAASSSVSAGLSVSALTENIGTGAANDIGVLSAPVGSSAYAGSDNHAAPFLEIGLNATSEAGTVTENGYSLNFNVTVAAGYSLEIASLTFDLGYDTTNTGNSHIAYFPQARLYVSDDNLTWTAVGAAEPLLVGTTSTNGAGYYFRNGISVSLSSLALPDAGGTLYFRLALAETTNASSVNSRRAVLDNITLNGSLTTVPESATAAFALGCTALAAMLVRRRL